MAHAEKCPVCYGSGRVRCDLSMAYPEPNEICNGCGGKGWVEVSDEIPVYIPINNENKL